MGRWIRRMLIAVAVVLGLGALAVLAGALYADHLMSKRWKVAAPGIRAATDPALVARGERFFRSNCLLCHGDGRGRASGQVMADVPSFLGTFHTANLTRHPESGIGRWSDADLARAIRYGVRPDGRGIFVMPQFPELSDEDVSALIGYLRSDDPIFAPVDVKHPALAPSLAGKLILTFVVGFDPTRAKREVVTAPQPGPTAAYGRYLTSAVVDCAGCHTAGFANDKVRGKGAWAGGFEFAGPDGKPLFSPNITPDADTGIGGWSQEDFVRAVRDGIRPDGRTLRPPMPLFRSLSDDELTAIYQHLRTLPPVRNAVERRFPEVPALAGADGEESPPRLFERHGCVACHGEGRPFRAKLRNALGHDLDEVAARILRPRDFSQDSQMPSFAGRIDEASAKRLAAWVKEQARSIPEAEVRGLRSPGP